MKFKLRFILLITVCLAAEDILYDAEYDLVINKLFKNYSKSMRPSYKVDAKINIILKQIINVDEKTQTITTSSFLFINWNDKRMKWNPIEFQNLTKVPVQAKNVWIPDLFVTNTVEQVGFLPISDSSLIWLYSNGSVYLTTSLNGKRSYRFLILELII